MTAPWMFRSLAAALFAVCVGLAALPGCGGPAPQAAKKDEKKDEPKPDGGANPNPPTPPAPNTGPLGPPKSTLGDAEPAAQQAATAFLRDVMHGTATADALSPAFLKAVGKPWAFPGDKEKGYSPNAAASWLKRIGDGQAFGLALKQEQVGDTVYIRGALQKPGGYCLRLVKDGGAWKVDWLSVTSVDNGTVATTATPEGAAQAFAVAAFVETIADLSGMPRDDRHLVVAAAMTKELRAAWAPAVFDQDKAVGYDYGPAKLATEATRIGGGTTAFTAARVGDQPEFKVELTKPAGKKTYAVKLVKGTGPNEWLIGEVTEGQPKG